MRTVALLQASVGAGAGLIRHEGGSSFSAVSLSPAIQRLTPSLYLGGGGALSFLGDGGVATQGHAEVWGSPPRFVWNDVRGAVNATLAASSRSRGVASGSAAALLELAWSKPRGGIAVGAGSVAGMIEGVPGVGSFRVRARSWWQRNERAPQLSFSVESTRFLGAWYTDFAGGVTLEQPRIIASFWATGRASAAYGGTAGASAAVQYFITPRVAIEASGGSYLRDPFQDLPRAGFGGAGVRLYARARPAAPTTPPAQQLRPLIAERRGADTAVVRFRMAGASAVAIAGSWNSWTPEPLRALGDDIWEGALQLRAGTYYFNLVVDGKEWVVPGGTAIVADGMGGLVAVLTVP